MEEIDKSNPSEEPTEAHADGKGLVDINNNIDYIIDKYEYTKVKPKQNNFDLDDYSNIDRVFASSDIDFQRASNQPWYDQAANAVVQMLGEVVGGTIQGIGSIVELPIALGEELAGSNSDWDNWIISIGRGITEGSQEIAPIYRKRSGEAFDMADSAWWFGNVPSIVSSLSMLIPARGAVKGLSLLAKMAKSGRYGMKGLKPLAEMNKVTRDLIKTGVGAGVMRNAENFREAYDVYREGNQQILDKLSNPDTRAELLEESWVKELIANKPNISDKDIAEYAASRASWRSYQINSSNIIFDVAQMGLFVNPAKLLTRGKGFLPHSVKTLEASGKALTKTQKVLRKTARGAVPVMYAGLEGLEEMVNFIGGEEGRAKLSSMMGEDISTFDKRLSEYLSDGHMYEAAFFGTIGGGIFTGAASLARDKKALGSEYSKIAAIENKKKRMGAYISKVKEINDSNETAEVKEEQISNLRTQMSTDMAVDYAQNGSLDILLSELEDPALLKRMEETGSISREDAQKAVADIKQDVLFAEKEFKRAYKGLFKADVSMGTKIGLSRSQVALATKISLAQKKLENLNTEILDISKDQPVEDKDFYNKVGAINAVESLKLQREALNRNLKSLGSSKLDESSKKLGEKLLKDIDSVITGLEKEIKEIKDGTTPKSVDENLTSLYAEKKYFDALSNVYKAQKNTNTTEQNAKDVEDHNINVRETAEKDAKKAAEKAAEAKKQAEIDKKNQEDAKEYEKSNSNDTGGETNPTVEPEPPTDSGKTDQEKEPTKEDFIDSLHGKSGKKTDSSKEELIDEKELSDEEVIEVLTEDLDAKKDKQDKEDKENDAEGNENNGSDIEIAEGSFTLNIWGFEKKLWDALKNILGWQGYGSKLLKPVSRIENLSDNLNEEEISRLKKLFEVISSLKKGDKIEIKKVINKESTVGFVLEGYVNGISIGVINDLAYLKKNTSDNFFKKTEIGVEGIYEYFENKKFGDTATITIKDISPGNIIQGKKKSKLKDVFNKSLVFGEGNKDKQGIWIAAKNGNLTRYAGNDSNSSFDKGSSGKAYIYVNGFGGNMFPVRLLNPGQTLTLKDVQNDGDITNFIINALKSENLNTKEFGEELGKFLMERSFNIDDTSIRFFLDSLKRNYFTYNFKSKVLTITKNVNNKISYKTYEGNSEDSIELLNKGLENLPFNINKNLVNRSGNVTLFGIEQNTYNEFIYNRAVTNVGAFKIGDNKYNVLPIKTNESSEGTNIIVEPSIDDTSIDDTSTPRVKASNTTTTQNGEVAFTFNTEQEAADFVEANNVVSGTIIYIKEEGYDGKLKVRNEEEIEFIPTKQSSEVEEGEVPTLTNQEKILSKKLKERKGQNLSVNSVGNSKFTKQKKDIKQQEKWFKDTFGYVQFNLIKGLINNGELAYGTFANAAVYLSDQAVEGTIYHEAFHVAMHLYLNKSQREKIYAEARKKHENKTNKQLEELVAEEFREWMITKQHNHKPKSFIGRWFAKLKKLIKHFTNSSTENLFEDIDSGKFNYPPSFASLKYAKELVLNKPVGNLSISEEASVIEDLSNIYLDSISDLTYLKYTEGEKEMYDILEGDNDSERLDYLVRLEIMTLGLDEVTSEYKTRYSNVYNELNKPNSELVSKVKANIKRVERIDVDRLKTEKGEKLDLTQTEFENALDYIGSEEYKDWDRDVVFTDLSIGKKVKRELRKLNAKSTDGFFGDNYDYKKSNLSSYLGIQKKLNLLELLPYMQTHLAGSKDSTEMMNRLFDFSKKAHPSFRSIYNHLSKSGNESVKSLFYSEFGTKQAPKIVMPAFEDGEISFRIVNENISSFNISQQFLDQAENHSDSSGKKSLENALKKVTSYKDKTGKGFGKLLSNAYKTMGISLENTFGDILEFAVNKEIENLKEGKIENYISNLKKNFNYQAGDYLENGNLQNQKSSLRSLAENIKLYNLNTVKNVIKNVMGNNMYAIQDSSFLSDLFLNINNLSALEIKEKYGEDPAFKQSYIYKNLVGENSESFKKDFNYYLLDGLKNLSNQKGVEYGEMTAGEFDILAVNMFLKGSYNKDNVFTFIPPVPADRTSLYPISMKMDPRLGSIRYAILDQVIGEIKSMYAAKERLFDLEGGNNTSKEKLVLKSNVPVQQYYDYNGDSPLSNGKATGNVFSFQIFPELNGSVDFLENGTLPYKTDDEWRKLLRPLVKDYLDKEAEELLPILGNVIQSNKIFEKDVKSKYGGQNVELKDAINHFSKSFTSYYKLFLTEYQTWVSGHSAEFKSHVDGNKRAGSAITPGERGDLSEVGPTFKYITIKDVIRPSTSLSDIISIAAKNLSQERQPTQQSGGVEVVSRYTNTDVKNNPNKIYVFGDNTQRKGTGGQAQIRNNENAFGIATKLQPNNSAAAFMSDNDLQSNKDVIDSDIAKIKADGRELVFPKDGFGTGLAKLKEKAPQTYSYLKQRLQKEFGFNNDTGVVSQPTQESSNVLSDDFTAQVIEAAKTGVIPTSWNAFEKKVYSKVGAFAAIVTTDAQGYVTLDRYVKILKKFGIYDEYKSTIEDIKAGRTVSVDKITSVLNALKPFYYDRRFDENLGRVKSTLVKYSLIPLIPASIKGTDLEKLNNWMIENNVDEAFYNTANKTGGVDIIDITNDDYSIKIDDLDTPESSIQLGFNDSYRIQQRLKDHLVDEKVTFGVQLKNILSNINDTDTYNFNNNNISGKELKDKFQESISGLSEIEYKNLIEELGATENENGDLIIKNLNSVEEIIKSSLDKRDWDFTIREMLEVKDGKFNVPLSYSGGSKQFETLFLSLFEKRVAKLKFPGGSVVQGSSAFFDRNNEKLEYKIDKDTGKVLYAEVYLPHHMKNLVDSDTVEATELFGFRTPFEKKSSGVMLKIKGYLPSNQGSTIIVADEIVALMGSDFDFDKLSFIKRNIPKNENELTEKQQLQNNVFEVFKSIYTSPIHALESITPQGFGTIKSVANDLRTIIGEEEQLPSSSYFSQRKYFERNSSGSTMKGIAANQNTAASVLQQLKAKFTNYIEVSYSKKSYDLDKIRDTFKEDIVIDNKDSVTVRHSKIGFNSSGGFTDVNGDTILDNGSEFIAAAVDGVNDPTFDVANINPYTFSVVNSMVITGIPIQVALYFSAQPIIKRATLLNSENRNITPSYINEINKVRLEFLNNSGVKDFKFDKIDVDKSYSQQFYEHINKKNDIKPFTLSKDALGRNLVGKENDIKHALDQLSVLDLFESIKENNGKPLSSHAAVLKLDSSGVGTSTFEEHNITSSIKELSDSKSIVIHANENDIYDDLVKSGDITQTNEEGEICAEDGLATSNFTSGGEWKVVKDLSGHPSHAKGGVNVNFTKDGVSFARGSSTIMAASGMVIPGDNVDDTSQYSPYTWSTRTDESAQNIGYSGSQLGIPEPIVTPMNESQNFIPQSDVGTSPVKDTQKDINREIKQNPKPVKSNYNADGVTPMQEIAPTPKQETKVEGTTDITEIAPGNTEENKDDNLVKTNLEPSGDLVKKETQEVEQVIDSPKIETPVEQTPPDPITNITDIAPKPEEEIPLNSVMDITDIAPKSPKQKGSSEEEIPLNPVIDIPDTASTKKDPSKEVKPLEPYIEGLSYIKSSEIEGGYSLNKDDQGNYLNKDMSTEILGTNFGITPNAFYNYYDRIPTAEDMKNLTKEQATEIYVKDYIKKPKFDTIPYKSIQTFAIDFGINSGTGRSTRYLQEVLGLTGDDIDSKWGTNTLDSLVDAVESMGEEKVLELFYNSRIKFLEESEKPTVVKHRESLIKRVKRVYEFAKNQITLKNNE